MRRRERFDLASCVFVSFGFGRDGFVVVLHKLHLCLVKLSPVISWFGSLETNVWGEILWSWKLAGGEFHGGVPGSLGGRRAGAVTVGGVVLMPPKCRLFPERDERIQEFLGRVCCPPPAALVSINSRHRPYALIPGKASPLLPRSERKIIGKTFFLKKREVGVKASSRLLEQPGRGGSLELSWGCSRCHPQPLAREWSSGAAFPAWSVPFQPCGSRSSTLMLRAIRILLQGIQES